MEPGACTWVSLILELSGVGTALGTQHQLWRPRSFPEVVSSPSTPVTVGQSIPLWVLVFLSIHQGGRHK